MTRSSNTIAAGAAMALLAIGTLVGAAAPANASYLGYGNGDPGDWSLWDEQNGGPKPEKATAPVRTVHHIHTHHARMPVRNEKPRY